jgi:hypothetical protein
MTLLLRQTAASRAPHAKYKTIKTTASIAAVSQSHPLRLIRRSRWRRSAALAINGRDGGLDDVRAGDPEVSGAYPVAAEGKIGTRPCRESAPG